MAEWKKVVVSGSAPEFSGVRVDDLTAGGVVIGGGNAGDLTATAVLTNGQLLIGDNTGAPTAATLSTTDSSATTSSLKIDNSAGGITLSVENNSIGIGNLSSSNAATAGNVLKVSADGQHITYGSAASGDVTSVITPANSGLVISDTSDTDGKVAITSSVKSLAASTAPLALDDTIAFGDTSDTTSVVTTKKSTITNFIGSISASISGSILSTISGDVNVTAGGASTIQSDAVHKEMLNSDVAGDGLVQGVGDAISMSISNLREVVVDPAADSFTFMDFSDENGTRRDTIADLATLQAGGGLEALTGVFRIETASAGGLKFDTNGDAGKLTVKVDATTGNNALSLSANGLTLASTIPGDRIFSGDSVKVEGNLSVAGTASFNHSTNLSVADKYILLNSGSATAGDGGIVIQQATNGVGELFGFDSTTNRFGITGSFNSDSSANFIPDAFFSMAISGSAGEDTPDTAPARYQQAGNIFAGANGDIYIYGN